MKNHVHNPKTIWHNHGHDPEKAHRIWKVWFERTLNEKAQAAMDRIDKMCLADS